MIESQLLPVPSAPQSSATPSAKLYNTTETVMHNFRMENEHQAKRERSPATKSEPAQVELGRAIEPDDEDDQYDDRSHSSSELNHEDGCVEHVENGQGAIQEDGKWESGVRSTSDLAAVGDIGPDIVSNTAGSEHTARLKSSPTSDSAEDTHQTRPGKPHGPNQSTKACAKKSFVWKYFRHPELITGVTDRSRTQCILCESQLAFNASGTTTTMLNHLKSRHGNVAEQEEFQRRHARPKASTASASQSPQNEGTADPDRSGDMLYVKHVKPSRSPNGQRSSRTVGLSRRPKLAKPSTDVSESGSLFGHGQMKLDPNLLFPIGCYPDLSENQHRALITEMLHSTAGVMANGRDQTVFNPFVDPHADLGVVLSGAGIRQPNVRRVEMSENPSVSLLNHNNNNIGNTNKLFSPPSLFNRATFLHAVNAFSNGIPFPVANPLMNTSGIPQNDLSPTASSGLGLSVSSPSGATTTSSTSPISSTENGHLTSPPTHPSHWSAGVQRQTHAKPTDIHGQDGAKNDNEPHGTEPTDLSAIGGTSSRTDSTTEPTCLATEKLVKVNAALLHRDNNAFGLGSTLLQQPPSVASNSPVDLAGAFGNAMNLATPIDNAIPYARFDPFAAIAQQQQQQVGQEKQHQWLTNAWLSGLANGKALHYPGAFVTPSAMMNFLNGTGANQTNTNTNTSEMYSKAATDNDAFCTTNCGTKDVDALTMAHTSSLGQLPQNQSLPVPTRLLDWSRLGQPDGVSAFLAAQSMLTSVPTSGFPDGSWPVLSEPAAPTSSSPQNPAVEDFDGTGENGTKRRFSRSSQSDSEETLDLSKPNVAPASPHCSSASQGTSNTKVPDDGGNITVSMKRKRARPVYISPDGNSKRPNVEEITSSSELRINNTTPMDVENDTNHTSRHAFVEQVARYLVQDMLPPEVADGEGFKVLMGFLAKHSPPSARELRNEVFPRAVSDLEHTLDVEVAELLKEESNEPVDGRSLTVALSAEMWSNAAPVSDQAVTGSVAEKAVHINLGVHGLEFQTPVVLRQMRDCFTVTDPRTLEAKLTQCMQSIHNRTQLSQSSPLQWPIPVVTNRPRELSTMLRSIKDGPNGTDHNRFVVIPCFVSELASSVQAGLNSGLVKATLIKCRTPHSSLYGESDWIKPSETTISWSEAFSITQSCLSKPDLYELTTEETDLLKQLQTVLETLNQTLQLLRQKNLKLTTSMIDPILHTLTGTHLSSEPDPAEAGDQHDFRNALVAFKRSVRSQLNQSYPLAGDLRNVLQLSSLLDPRFKDHMNEREPSALSLLKEKVEAVPSENLITDQSTDTTNPSPSKSASTTEELQTVFGLRPYSRASLSEVERYLREDPISLEQDPFAWWVEKSHSYPRVAVLASYYLNIPLTCFAHERLTALDQLPKSRTRKYALLADGLGLPNLVDPLAAGRKCITSEDQSFYNLLWHQWAVPHPL